MTTQPFAPGRPRWWGGGAGVAPFPPRPVPAGQALDNPAPGAPPAPPTSLPTPGAPPWPKFCPASLPAHQVAFIPPAPPALPWPLGPVWPPPPASALAPPEPL